MDKFVNFKNKPKSFFIGKFIFMSRLFSSFKKQSLVIIPYFFFFKRSSAVSLTLKFYIINPFISLKFNQNWYFRKKYPINKPAPSINLLALL